MNDTPPEIKKLQLEIWLSKPPMERLRIALEDNDAFFGLVNEIKKNLKQHNDSKPIHESL